MIIKSYELSELLLTEIGRFAILWNYFEEKFFDCYCSHLKIINKFNEITFDNAKAKSLQNVFIERIESYGLTGDENINRKIIQSYVKSVFWDDAPRKGKKKKEMDEEISAIIDFCTKDEPDVCGCLFLLYRIRNNLMHGVKQLPRIDNQFDIFQAANNVLETIERTN